jgi:hypothetical protein
MPKGLCHAGPKLLSRGIRFLDAYYVYDGLSTDILDKMKTEIEESFSRCWDPFKEECKAFEELKAWSRKDEGPQAPARPGTIPTSSNQGVETKQSMSTATEMKPTTAQCVSTCPTEKISIYMEEVILSSCGFDIIGEYP